MNNQLEVKMEKWKSGTGQKLMVHERGTCDEEFCPIHNPSDHHMRDWPQHWRYDRGILERICPCGVGHPDPDDRGDDRGIHGCCGCCAPKPKPPLGRIIKEGDTRAKCKKCGSSRAWTLWPFIKSKFCIQPKCENYILNN
jgi:hypothetical protein